MACVRVRVRVVGSSAIRSGRVSSSNLRGDFTLTSSVVALHDLFSPAGK